MSALHRTGVTTILLDADGTLFPSEEPAYAASASVTQAFAERFGLEGDFSAENLRRTGTGRNFRSLTRDLLAEAGVDAAPDELEQWIERERVEVTAYLAATLRPDPDVVAVIDALLRDFKLAVVSSSATPRLLACLAATGLGDTFAPEDIFSAEDSMPEPVSKPDPAIYRHALTTLGVDAGQALAVEDSATGSRSALAAGIRTLGIVAFVAPDEQDQRVRELGAAGAAPIVGSWRDLGDAVLGEPVGTR